MVNPLVTVEGGELEGRQAGEVQTYLGIPFAAPPVGSLRFQPPQPPPAWGGIRDASRFGPSAMQVPTALEAAQRFPGPCSEDCLYLNVWTPEAAGRKSGRLPVLVWVHGGAFVNGSGSVPWYDGTKLAARGDVVVVTLNYRLGPFGYLDLSEIGGDAFRRSGNLGLLDQIAAIGWVRDNIEAFGGDPSRICLVGESAGAMGIGTLLTAEPARGLVQRAVMQSGTPVASPAAASQRMARATLDLLGLSWDPTGVAQLTELDANAILMAGDQMTQQAHAAGFAGDSQSGFGWGPVVDGVVVVDDPWAATAAGAAADVSVLIGTTADEMRVTRILTPDLPDIDRASLVERMRFLEGDGAQRVVAAYEARYPGASPDDVWCSVLSDRVFGLPTRAYLGARASAGAPTWSYAFDWASPAGGGRYGSCHTFDIPFVFGTFDTPGIPDLLGPDTEARRTLSATMQDAWVSFAERGDPSSGALSGWKQVADDPSVTMRLGDVCGMGPDTRPVPPG